MVKEVILNKYVLRWEGDPCPLSVDAPSMSIAVELGQMRDKCQREPTTVTRVEEGIRMLTEVPTLYFDVVIVDENDNNVEEGTYGNVYPTDGHIPYGYDQLFTAVPKAGYRFVYYYDKNDDVISWREGETITLNTKHDTIYAKFAPIDYDITNDKRYDESVGAPFIHSHCHDDQVNIDPDGSTKEEAEDGRFEIDNDSFDDVLPSNPTDDPNNDNLDFGEDNTTNESNGDSNEGEIEDPENKDQTGDIEEPEIDEEIDLGE